MGGLPYGGHVTDPTCGLTDETGLRWAVPAHVRSRMADQTRPACDLGLFVLSLPPVVMPISRRVYMLI